VIIKKIYFFLSNSGTVDKFRVPVFFIHFWFEPTENLKEGSISLVGSNVIFNLHFACDQSANMG
jgi:hypothetical protein